MTHAACMRALIRAELYGGSYEEQRAEGSLSQWLVKRQKKQEEGRKKSVYEDLIKIKAKRKPRSVEVRMKVDKEALKRVDVQEGIVGDNSNRRHLQGLGRIELSAVRLALGESLLSSLQGLNNRFLWLSQEEATFPVDVYRLEPDTCHEWL